MALKDFLAVINEVDLAPFVSLDGGENYVLGSYLGFTENDSPNFFGSNYSLIKGFTDRLMKQTNCLNLRIRMPICNDFNSQKNIWCDFIGDIEC